MTCEQVSIALGMRYTSVSARLSELKRAGQVIDTGKTQKTTGGEQAALIATKEIHAKVQGS